MQVKQVALACGVAFAALAGQATAATVTFSPEVTINAAGASALRLSFGQSIVDICSTAAADPRLWFQDSAGGTNRRAYFCRTSTTVGLPAAVAGKLVLIHKRDQGGSSRGVTPAACKLLACWMMRNRPSPGSSAGGGFVLGAASINQ